MGGRRVRVWGIWILGRCCSFSSMDITQVDDLWIMCDTMIIEESCVFCYLINRRNIN